MRWNPKAAEERLVNLVHPASDAVAITYLRIQYLDPAIALLSHSLPGRIALPATAQTLFLSLFENAAHSPGANTIRPVYQILQGSCHDIIGTLSAEVLVRLENHLFTILRNASGVEDQSLSLYCLSIMKIISQSSAISFVDCGSRDVLSSLAPHLQGTPDLRASGWKPEAMEQFFTGAKASKTLQLIALRVLWACRTDSDALRSEELTCLLLANGIANAISPAVRVQWCAKNPAIMQKLHQRCLSKDIAPALTFQVLDFAGTLAGADALPAQARGQYEWFLTKLDQVNPAHEVPNLLTSVMHFASAISTACWTSVLDRIVGFLDDNNTPECLSVTTYTGLITRLAGLVEEVPNLRRAVLSAASTEPTSAKVERFLRNSAATDGCCTLDSTSQHTACSTSFLQRRNELASATCALMLRCAIAAQNDEVQMPSVFVPLLLKIHAEHGRPRSVCAQHSSSLQRNKQYQPFVETESTPNVTVAAGNWKDRISARLQKQAKHQEETVISYFVETCRELEERCHNIEAPLRQERERFVGLESRYNELCEAYNRLESDVVDRDLHISDLEERNEQYTVDVDQANARYEDLFRKLNETTAELHKAKEVARNDRETAAHREEEMKLAHATSIAWKEERLEQLEEQIRSAKRTAELLQSQLQDAQSRVHELQNVQEKLIQNCDGIQQLLQEKIDLLEDMENERGKILLGRQQLEQRIREQEDNLSARQRDNEALESAIQDAMRARHELEAAAVSAERRMTEATSRVHLCLCNVPSRILLTESSGKRRKQAWSKSCKPSRTML